MRLFARVRISNILCLACAITLAGCKDNNSNKSDDQRSVDTEDKTELDDPNTNTKIYVPRGSNGQKPTVRVDDGSTVANDVTGAYLTLPSGIRAIGKSVYIAPKSNNFASTDMVIALFLTDQAAKADRSLLAVFYHVWREDGNNYLGMIPSARLDFELNPGFVTFSATGFGDYQIGLLPTATQQITEVLDKKISAPPPTPEPLSITARQPLVIKAGDTVNITGTGFRQGMTIALGGKDVDAIHVASDAKASFVAPSGSSAGFLDLVATQGTQSATVTLLYRGGNDELPVMTADRSRICSDQQFYDADGTLVTGTRNCTALTGSATGDVARHTDLLSGKSAWSSDGTVINGTMANNSGPWAATTWPGAGYYDAAPTNPINALLSSGMYHDKSSGPMTIAQELALGSSSLPTGFHEMPRIASDDDGYDGAVAQPSPRPSKVCGTTGTLSARISNCSSNNPNSASWNGATNGNSSEGSWTLVTVYQAAAADGANCSSCTEVWRDDRTGLIWSDRITNGTTTTFNWCHVTGVSQGGPLGQDDIGGGFCNSGASQNQTTPVSLCYEYEGLDTPNFTFAAKGNLRASSIPAVHWRVPTIHDWEQAELDGVRFVLPNMLDVDFFWSASIYSSSSRTNGWRFNSMYGYALMNNRANFFSARCVGR